MSPGKWRPLCLGLNELIKILVLTKCYPKCTYKGIHLEQFKSVPRGISELDIFTDLVTKDLGWNGINVISSLGAFI